jgi:ATP-dependent Lon protease
MSNVNSWLKAKAIAEAAGRVIERVPVIPLRDIVVYPAIVMPVFIRRHGSVKAAEAAMRTDRRVMLVTQRQPSIDDPTAEDLRPVGTSASVMDMKLVAEPQGVHMLTVTGVTRARVDAFYDGEDSLSADISLLADTLTTDELDLETLRNSVLTRFEQHARSSGWPPKGLKSLGAIAEGVGLASMLAYLGQVDPGRLADQVAAHGLLSLEQKQAVLEILDVRKRLEYVDSVLRNTSSPPVGEGG